MKHQSWAGVLFFAVLIAACSGPAAERPRYHPDAPAIETVSASLEGDGWRFEVGVDGDCLDFRIQSAGFADTGGTVCHHGSERQREVEHPQVHPSHRSSSADLLVVDYDGCVRAPSIQGIRAWDSQTTTTICDSRVPALVFGHLRDDLSYACVVTGNAFSSFGFYPAINEDGLFLYMESADTPSPGFVIGFTTSGHWRDFEPVDAPFAPGLDACEQLGPWRDQPGWGDPPSG